MADKKVSLKKMLACTKCWIGEGPEQDDCPIGLCSRMAEAIRAALLRLDVLEKTMKKFKKRAKLLIDDGLFDGAQGRWVAATFVERIRDFGEEAADEQS